MIENNQLKLSFEATSNHHKLAVFKNKNNNIFSYF